MSDKEPGQKKWKAILKESSERDVNESFALGISITVIEDGKMMKVSPDGKKEVIGEAPQPVKVTKRNYKLASPRIRILAGPNGSGKTSLVPILSKYVNLGFFLNADELEASLKVRKFLNLEDYNLQLLQSDIDKHVLQSWSRDKALASKIALERNVLIIKEASVDSYLAAAIIDLLRYSLLETGQSFTFETVMSHEEKVDFISFAKQKGYRTYLYYIGTEQPSINISRIENRIEKGGHAVPVSKAKERYVRSLDLLYSAVKAADRAYIFDNSASQRELVAQVSGSNLHLLGAEVPAWVNHYLLEKL